MILIKLQMKLSDSFGMPLAYQGIQLAALVDSLDTVVESIPSTGGLQDPFQDMELA